MVPAANAAPSPAEVLLPRRGASGLGGGGAVEVGWVRRQGWGFRARGGRRRRSAGSAGRDGAAGSRAAADVMMEAMSRADTRNCLRPHPCLRTRRRGDRVGGGGRSAGGSAWGAGIGLARAAGGQVGQGASGQGAGGRGVGDGLRQRDWSWHSMRRRVISAGGWQVRPALSGVRRGEGGAQAQFFRTRTVGAAVTTGESHEPAPHPHPGEPKQEPGAARACAPSHGAEQADEMGKRAGRGRAHLRPANPRWGGFSGPC
jgi:hypothetical protein